MNIQNISLLAVAAALFLAPFAEAKPGRDYVSRSVENPAAFKAVEVRGDAEVDFAQRAETSVSVSGSERAVEAARVNVENGTLVVSYTKPFFSRGKDKVRVLVTAPELAVVTVSQKAELNVRGALKTEALALNAFDDGEISVDDLETVSLSVTALGRAEVDVNRLAAETVRASASDRADIELSGMAQEAFLENNGSGDIDAGDLRVFSAKAVVNASGDVEVFATQTLDASALGRGKIEYKGVPARINPSGDTRKIEQDL